MFENNYTTESTSSTITAFRTFAASLSVEKYCSWRSSPLNNTYFFRLFRNAFIPNCTFHLSSIFSSGIYLNGYIVLTFSCNPDYVRVAHNAFTSHFSIVSLYRPTTILLTSVLYISRSNIFIIQILEHLMTGVQQKVISTHFR